MSGGRWFVGSFEQTFPPIVPRFRTWTSAIVETTSPRIGRAGSGVEVGRITPISILTLKLNTLPSGIFRPGAARGWCRGGNLGPFGRIY